MTARATTQCTKSHEPVVREFFDIHHSSGMPNQTLTETAGLCLSAPYYWKRGACPTVASFNAALGVHGYELAVVKINSPRE